MPLQIWFHQDNTSTVQCRRHFHSFLPFALPSSNWISLQLSYLSSDITRRDSHDTHPTETSPDIFGPFQLRRSCTFRHFRNLRAEKIERKWIRKLCSVINDSNDYDFSLHLYKPPPDYSTNRRCVHPPGHVFAYTHCTRWLISPLLRCIFVVVAKTCHSYNDLISILISVSIFYSTTFTH